MKTSKRSVLDTSKHSILVAALALVVGMDASLAAEPVGEGAEESEPSVAIVPPAFVRNAMLTTGCWARLYDGANFGGRVLTVAGPVDLPKSQLRPSFTWGGLFDSLVVGPKATLIAFEAENYTDRSATFQPGQRVPALDAYLGSRRIRSLRITCKV
jgi:hypothetical protein